MTPRPRFGALLLLVTIVASLGVARAQTVGQCPPVDNSNKTQAKAATLATPAECVADIGPDGGDSDWYTFKVSNAQTINLTVRVANPNDAFLVQLIGPSTALSCTLGTDGISWSCTKSDALEGDWYIRIVASKIATKDNYHLSLTVADPNPVGVCPDGSRVSATATSLYAPLVCLADLSSGEDWYSVKIVAGDASGATFVGATIPLGDSMHLEFYAPGSKTPDPSTCQDINVSTAKRATLCAAQRPQVGIWRLRVSSNTGASGNYILALDKPSTTLDGDTCEPGGDSTENAPEALPPVATYGLVSLSACLGSLTDSRDAMDAFTRNVNTPGLDANFIAGLVPVTSGAMRMTLAPPKNAGAQDVACPLPANTIPTEPTICVGRAVTQGNWTINVTGDKGGPYLLFILVFPSTTDPASLAPTCEPKDAGDDATNATALPAGTAVTPTETQNLCRGTLTGTDTADWFTAQVRSSQSEVDIFLSPSNQPNVVLPVPSTIPVPPTLPSVTPPQVQSNDLTLRVFDSAGNECTVTKIGAGQPSYLHQTAKCSGAGSMKGPWKIGVTRAAGSASAAYSLGVSIADR